jgi:hypothetical protein
MTVMDALVSAVAAHPEKTPSDVFSEAVGIDGAEVERRLLCYAGAATDSPMAMVCVGCAWRGRTTSTNCGSCGHRLRPEWPS